jgi:hypothetical protein
MLVERNLFEKDAWSGRRTLEHYAAPVAAFHRNLAIERHFFSFLSGREVVQYSVVG